VRQVIILSGKGGTGKTVITAAFAYLVHNKVLADCDVDAANMHILLSPEIKERYVFHGGQRAFIDSSKCLRCGRCRQYCRFTAINDNFLVDGSMCEGCGFCKLVCPAEAVSMKEVISGEWFVSSTRYGKMVHARLGIAEENSGKLVALVRKKAKQIAEEDNCDWVIIDGPPGIGCPVISSLSGVDYALVVTEPTLSGLHDADRVIKVARHFGISVGVVINKYDLNKEMADKIERYCDQNNVAFLGRIAFDRAVVDAVVSGKTIMEVSGLDASYEITCIWDKITQGLSN